MQISDKGLALLERCEGFRAHVYNDVAGIPTIGYGHRLQPGESFPGGVTQPQAQLLLRHDLLCAQILVERLVKVPLTQGQFDALVDFVYNLGSGRLQGSTLLAELNAGKYDAVPAELLLWDRAGGRVVPQLAERRAAEVELWRSVA